MLRGRESDLFGVFPVPYIRWVKLINPGGGMILGTGECGGCRALLALADPSGFEDVVEAVVELGASRFLVHAGSCVDVVSFSLV